jgi:dihydropyrimidinase
MICFSEIAGYPHLYFVHVSTRKGLDEIIAARSRGAENIYAETCPQYLTLTEGKYMEGPDGGAEEGLKYIMAPPLRKQADVEALWKGIRNRDIDVIATDHCPFFLDQKLDGRQDFRAAPGGIPGVEERMEVILTEGTRRGIPIGTLISLLSVNPAKIYGLYPKKGAVMPGSDADIAVIRKG